MSLAVVFLPDTALLVPGAAGRADPAAGLRDAAVAALGDLAGADADGSGRVLVVAPARRDRFLAHPVAPGLGAAGLDLPDLDGATPASGPAAPDRAADPDADSDADPAVGTGATSAPDPTTAPRADVPASVALVLLRAAGVRAPVDVLEVDRAAVDVLAPPPSSGDLRAVVVVGSLSARHGPDAPLADDPRAPAADDALLAALAEGPAALARALDGLGADGARDLAVSGRAPWRAVLALLPAGAAAEAATLHPEVVAGAQHVVAAWRLTARAPLAAPAALAASAAPASAPPAATASPAVCAPHDRPVPHHPEEPR
ncbi:hypothetical protein [Cellulomonas sp. Y8]|uniref:hypothetical protein n=1 Tax=Cellulomonas sp. Y8 TaxID=2591145 RepID=UPI003D7211EE